MTELAPLIFTALFLHLFDSVRRVVPGAAVLRPAWKQGKMRLGRPLLYPSNGDWGWVVANVARPWRAVFLAENVTGSYSLDAVRERVTDFERETVGLRRLVQAAMAWMFLGIPGLSIAFGVNLALIPASVILFALMWAAARLYWRAYKRLFPLRDQPFGGTLRTALYPIGMLWAVDELGRDLFAGHSRLSVACALCEKAEVAAFAKRELIAAKYPMAGEPVADIAEMEKALRSVGLDARLLLKAPERTELCLTWCPRCESQYRMIGGECPDCPGVALVGFEPVQGGRR